PPSVLDQDAPHRFGRGGEKVATAVPVLGLFDIHQAQIGLVNQGRGLKRLAWLLLSEFLGCELAQFVIDQGQQLVGSLRIALLDSRQDARNFVHGSTETFAIPSGISSPTSVSTVRNPGPIVR